MKNIFEYVDDNLNKARIFIIIKPGFFKYSQQIIEKFAEKGWDIERSRTKQLLLKEAKALYKIHKDEDWYQPLCEYMSSAPTTAFILVRRFEKMNDSVFEETGKIKDEIRKEWGESDMRNVIHSSDSLEHMKTECGIYF